MTEAKFKWFWMSLCITLLLLQAHAVLLLPPCSFLTILFRLSCAICFLVERRGSPNISMAFGKQERTKAPSLLQFPCAQQKGSVCFRPVFSEHLALQCGPTGGFFHELLPSSMDTQSVPSPLLQNLLMFVSGSNCSMFHIFLYSG